MSRIPKVVSGVFVAITGLLPACGDHLDAPQPDERVLGTAEQAAEVPVICPGGVGNAAALIAAIEAANATQEADTIELTAGCEYEFTAADNHWYGSNALPPITSEIAIEGNGATILRSNADPDLRFRLFYVAGSAVAPATSVGLTLREVTLSGGIAAGGNGHGGGGGGLGAGGAIFAHGDVTLDRVLLTDHEARGGDGATSFYGGGGGMGTSATAGAGGGFGGTGPYGGVGTGGAVTPGNDVGTGGDGGHGTSGGGGAGGSDGGDAPSGSDGSPGNDGSDATGGDGGNGGFGGGGGGGGIAYAGAGGDGENAGDNGGAGGVANAGRGGNGGFGGGGGAGGDGVGGPGGAGQDSGSGGNGGEASGGDGGDGGFGGGAGDGGRGVGGDGGSSPNGSPGGGGAGTGGNGGDTRGSSSVVGADGTEASGDGSGTGGTGEGGKGADDNGHGDGTVDLSARIGGGGAGFGGAVFVYGATLDVVNSTITNCRALGGGATGGNPGSGFGAGIFVLNGTLNLTHTTIAFNTTSSTGPDVGGAVYLLSHGDGSPTATGTIRNSILSNTSDTQLAPAGDLCVNQDAGTAALTAADDNVVMSSSDISATALTGSPRTDDPLLAALDDHGGPTWVLMPQDGPLLTDVSPAIDTADPVVCAALNPVVDQRGFERRALCDVGAMEVGASRCGDGRMDGAEVCDDGNTADNDSCPSTCGVETEDEDADEDEDSSSSDHGDDDADNDGLGNGRDNCPDADNVDQADADEDGIGDACDFRTVSTSSGGCSTGGDRPHGPTLLFGWLVARMARRRRASPPSAR